MRLILRTGMRRLSCPVGRPLLPRFGMPGQSDLARQYVSWMRGRICDLPGDTLDMIHLRFGRKPVTAVWPYTNGRPTAETARMYEDLKEIGFGDKAIAARLALAPASLRAALKRARARGLM